VGASEASLELLPSPEPPGYAVYAVYALYVEWGAGLDALAVTGDAFSGESAREFDRLCPGVSSICKSAILIPPPLGTRAATCKSGITAIASAIAIGVAIAPPPAPGAVEKAGVYAAV